MIATGWEDQLIVRLKVSRNSATTPLAAENVWASPSFLVKYRYRKKC